MPFASGTADLLAANLASLQRENKARVEVFASAPLKVLLAARNEKGLKVFLKDVADLETQVLFVFEVVLSETPLVLSIEKLLFTSINLLLNLYVYTQFYTAYLT